MRLIKANDLMGGGHKIAAEELVCSTKFCSPVHYHEHYELFYLKSNDRQYVVNQQRYNLKQHDLMLLKPYDVHYTTFLADPNYHRILVNFAPDVFEGLEAELLCSLSHVRMLHAEAGQIEHIMKQLVQETKRQDQYGFYAMKGLLLELAVLVQRQRTGPEPQAKEAALSKHEAIVEFVRSHYHENLTLAGLSEQFNISVGYLCKMFHKQTHCTFNNFLNHIRMLEAQKLLLHSALNITEIASVVGYESPSHFTRVFKCFVGESPLRYRQAGSTARLQPKVDTTILLNSKSVAFGERSSTGPDCGQQRPYSHACGVLIKDKQSARSS